MIMGLVSNNVVRGRPYPQDYRPEFYISNEIDVDSISRYPQFIGVFRW